MNDFFTNILESILFFYLLLYFRQLHNSILLKLIFLGKKNLLYISFAILQGSVDIFQENSVKTGMVISSWLTPDSWL